MEILDSVKFRAAVKQGLSGGYLFFGEEEYLKHSCLDLVRKAVLGDNTGDSFNHIRLDGESFSFDALENAIISLPVFSDNKLVEIHSIDLNSMKEKEIEELCSTLSMLEGNPETVLIFYCAPFELDAGDPRRPSKLLSALSRVVVAVGFEKQTREKLAKWVIAHFNHNKVACSKEMSMLLLDTCGHDMYALAGETEKLCAYVLQSGRNEVGAADIELLATKNKEIGEFDFSNAILGRNVERSFYILSKYEMEDKSGKEVNLILGSIIRIFTSLYKISLLSQKGMRDDEIAKELKMNPYQCSLYRKNLGRRTPAELERILLLCREADAQLKSGTKNGYEVLSRLIIGAAR